MLQFHGNRSIQKRGLELSIIENHGYYSLASIDYHIKISGLPKIQKPIRREKEKYWLLQNFARKYNFFF
jgi:hypothetical protein